MVQVTALSQRERLILAELSGVAGRYSTGVDRDRSQDEAIAAIRAVTTDARLLGIQAGVALADPCQMSGKTVRLLKAAGADMAVAAGHAMDVRERMRRQGARYPHEDLSPRWASGIRFGGIGFGGSGS
ncbi:MULTISPECIES: hypothetical protein [Micromonospora]|uniref:hypothetical protein n=1 Tax=Micromonospora TaxID=1873 RepID=UPI001FD0EBF1|nr:hypothetical protein [Micromonospora tulbaghiae]